MTAVLDGLRIEPAAAVRGRPTLPGDKSISHRALMLALLAEGRSTISGASEGGDVRSTCGLVEALGATVDEAPGEGSRPGILTIDSPGVDGLQAPRAALDCGNSGTSLRLFAGILAGQAFEAVLDGDASLRRRPIGRVAEPLRAMGAELRTAEGDRAPVRIRGRHPLRAIDWTPTVASAQVKSAILLAALRALGTTRVHERIATRDHTERMLRARGVAVVSAAEATGGTGIEIEGGQAVQPHAEVVPRDASAAAFWLVAGAAHPQALIELGHVGVNPGRRVAIDLLREMGARIDESAVTPRGGSPDVDGSQADGPDVEPAADLRVVSSDLRGIDVDPSLVALAIDEIPILCVAATQARGTTTFRGAGELRVKESDRLAGIVDGLGALGANVSVDGDDVRIVGPTALRGASVDGLGDHRLVMAFAIAGLLASGVTTVAGATSAAISDPGFFAELERIRS
jgi:3-phosphoshikimate 1-carboxyvinyltransferase